MAVPDDFAGSISRLCSRELPFARRDPERGAVMIERLVASLALTLAVVGGGDAVRIETLLMGVEGRLQEAVTEYQAVEKLLK